MSTQCDRCLVSFATASSLKRHLARTKPCVPLPGTKYYTCECGAYFARKDGLTRHIKEACGKPKTGINNNPNGLEEAHEIAAAKNGECLSVIYETSKTHMQWKCNKDGHVWGASLDNIKRGKWCPKCAGRPKHTIEEAQQYAVGHDGVCLSGAYVNGKEPLRWKCNIDGTEWSAGFDNVLNKASWCPECGKRHKTEKEVRELFEFFTDEKFPETPKLFPQNPRWKLDGYCRTLGIAFEYHGPQHYGVYPFFHRNGIKDLEKQQARDKAIEDTAPFLDEPISLIVIPHTFGRKERIDFVWNQLSLLGVVTDE